MIGKRKRETTVASRKKAAATTTKNTSENNSSSQENHQDLFRKYFEARFKPIETEVDIRGGAEGDTEKGEGEDELVESESEPGSEWDGLSGSLEDEDEDEEGEVEVVQPVEVVAYDSTERREDDDELAKLEFKSFMVRNTYTYTYIITTNNLLSQSSKPPSSQPPTTTNSKHRSSRPEDTEPETATDSLKNDLALQRLLKESHLLTPSSSTSTLNPVGKNRHKAIDLRMQDLGSKGSIFAQEKMPLGHRRGIIEKAGEREERRRREAKENGIVLEREKREKKKGDGKRRERGIGGPSVGSFKGGMLRLSKKDVLEIQGPKKGGKGKGKGGKGGKGRSKKPLI